MDKSKIEHTARLLCKAFGGNPDMVVQSGTPLQIAGKNFTHPRDKDSPQLLWQYFTPEAEVFLKENGE